MSTTDELRKLSKAQLALAVAGLVREVVCPDGDWSIERGRECIEVLLIAARMAYPTTADIESLGKNNTISKVAVELADQIDVIKEEAKANDRRV